MDKLEVTVLPGVVRKWRGKQTFEVLPDIDLTEGIDMEAELVKHIDGEKDGK